MLLVQLLRVLANLILQFDLLLLKLDHVLIFYLRGLRDLRQELALPLLSYLHLDGLVVANVITEEFSKSL